MRVKACFILSLSSFALASCGVTKTNNLFGRRSASAAVTSAPLRVAAPLSASQQPYYPIKGRVPTQQPDVSLLPPGAKLSANGATKKR